jgi:hypothetical protein
MPDFKRSLLILVCLLFCACTPREPGISQGEPDLTDFSATRTTRASLEPIIRQGEAEALAWQALQPYTHSRDRANWAIQQTQIIQGDTLPAPLQKERDETCFRTYSTQPPPPENIQPSFKYWLVIFVPLPATAQVTPLSVTAPPRIPEPFVRQAYILIEANTGKLGAFRLSCVIY